MTAALIFEKTVLAGKYALEEAIGRGGMGTVYRATHLILGCNVAVKMLDTGADAHLAEHFLREARLATAARHPNVVGILDFGTTDEGVPFMVMEYLEGRSLSDYLEDGPLLTLAQQVGIVAQMLSGLDAVHRAGIVHRDLKPGNVFVTELDDGSLIARLLDFGVSFSVDPNSEHRRGRFGTDARLITGTPEYMSAEQAEGRPDIDLRADLHSVGVILYELLSAGALPYTNPLPAAVLFQIMKGTHTPLGAHRPDLPELAEVVERAIQNDRTLRPSSAGVMRAELLDAFHRTTARASFSQPFQRPAELTDGVSGTRLASEEAPRAESAPSLTPAPPAPPATWRLPALFSGVAVTLLAGLALFTLEDPVLVATGADSHVAAVSVALPVSPAVSVGSSPSTPLVTDPTPAVREADVGPLAPTGPLAPAAPAPRRRHRAAAPVPGEIRRELDF